MSTPSQSDLADLPQPVQRYLRKAGIVGKPRIKKVHTQQRGRIRLKENGRWQNFVAHQVYGSEPPSFEWFGKIVLAGIPIVSAHDSYINTKGRMHIRFLSAKTIEDARGPEMDHASLMRYLNELVFLPTAYLGPNIHWESLDNHSAKLTIKDDKLEASAIVHFNDADELVNFVTKRYRSEEFGRIKWSTPFHSYGEHQGLRIPTRGSAIWHTPSGEFKYIDVEITGFSLEY